MHDTVSDAVAPPDREYPENRIDRRLKDKWVCGHHPGWWHDKQHLETRPAAVMPLLHLLMQ
jgi:hypothetical protein